jgi:hypothetical protein
MTSRSRRTPSATRSTALRRCGRLEYPCGRPLFAPRRVRSEGELASLDFLPAT